MVYRQFNVAHCVQEFLGGTDQHELEATVSKYNTMVEAYGASSIPEAMEGVEEAMRLRDEAAAALSKYTQLQAKLEAAVAVKAASA